MSETLPEFNVICREAGRYFEDGDNENALAYYRNALDLIEGKEEFNQEKIMVLSNIGLALVKLKFFERSIKAFKRAADISASLGEKHHFAGQMGNIGSAYRDMEEYDSALPYYRDALKVFEETGDTAGIASQYSNIAYIYAMTGKNQMALEWFEKSKAKFEASGSREQADLALRNIETIKSVISGGK